MANPNSIFPGENLCDAAAQTKRWRLKEPNGLKGFYIPRSDLAGIQNTIISLLSPDPNFSIVGVRIYNGLGIAGEMSTHQIYIVPVGPPFETVEGVVNGADILCVMTPVGARSTIYGPALTCQPFCSTTFNPLNDSDLDCTSFPCPPTTPPQMGGGPFLSPPPPAANVCAAAAATQLWRALPKNYPKGFFIPIPDFVQLMDLVNNTPGILGIRLYNALSDTDQHHLYIVPVGLAPTVVENNVLNGGDLLCLNSQSVIYDTTQPCPRMCSTKDNPLNSDAPCTDPQFACG